MKSYPLVSLTIQQAMQKQFSLVDHITKEFTGLEVLSQGDLGLIANLNQPTYTKKVEKVLANFFNAEACVLVRGAGTNAIREAFSSIVKYNDTILVHEAPIYETTKVTFEVLGLKYLKVNFNNLNEVKKAVKENKINAALVQLSRQALNDSYDFEEVITIIKKQNIPIITDDNYAVMKIAKIGVEAGSDLSAFSLFKLLGPPGIGCIVGKDEYISKIKKSHYSGGSQIQGYEAMDAMRSLIYAPVALAIQATIVDEVAHIIKTKNINGIKNAYVVNAQSKVIIVELEKNNAKNVLIQAQLLGAAPHPVGAESKYEITPMFYRVSKTMCDSIEDAENKLIRINPMRAGSQTIIRILEESILGAENND